MTGLPKKQRERLEEADCKHFGESILKFITENENWSSSTYSTAMHRLDLVCLNSQKTRRSTMHIQK